MGEYLFGYGIGKMLPKKTQNILNIKEKMINLAFSKLTTPTYQNTQ